MFVLSAFALQTHEAADRDPVDGVDRAALLHSEDARRKTEAELFDRDTGLLGTKEMSALVREHDDRQDDDEGDHSTDHR